MESQLGSPVALSLRVRGSVGHNFKHLTLTREPITLNISEFGSATLIKTARIWNDSCMLLHIDGRDTIVMEIKYHRSCYKNYVPPEQLTKLEEQNCQERRCGN